MTHEETEKAIRTCLKALAYDGNADDTVGAILKITELYFRSLCMEEAAKHADAFAERQANLSNRAETDEERNQLEHGNWVAGMIALRIRHAGGCNE